MTKTIDIHTHGIGGYDTETDSVRDILKIAEIQGSRGVSEIILAVYPSEVENIRRKMAVIKNAMDMQNHETNSAADIHSNSNKMPSRIIGIHLEGPFLNKNMCGSLNPDNFLEPSEYRLRKLIEGFENIVRIITIAPELQGAANTIRKAADMGIIVSMGHSEATYYEAEIGFNAGAKGITHIFNAMRGFHHREPGIAGFALMNRHIYTEVISDSHHLHPAVIEMIFLLKNHERIIIISDSVRETGLSSHIKAVTDISGRLCGGSMAITWSADRLIERGFDKDMIFRCITENPRRYLTDSH